MPELPIAKPDGRLSRTAGAHVLAAMLHPDDRAKRRHVFLALGGGGRLEFKREHLPALSDEDAAKVLAGTREVLIDAIPKLLRAGSYDQAEYLVRWLKTGRDVDLAPLVREAMRPSRENGAGPLAAGAVLYTVMRLARYWPNRAGTTTAVGLLSLEGWGAPTAIKQAWRRWRSVSHLWGALYVAKLADLAWPDVFAEELPQFLGVAERLHRFGARHRPPGAEYMGRAILGPDTVVAPVALRVQPLHVGLVPLSEKEEHYLKGL